MTVDANISKRPSGVRRGGYERAGKRFLDLAIAVPVAILAAPVSVVLAALIRAEDGGPAVFRQVRVGRDGSTFMLRKFRTMPVNTANVPSAHADGLRVTRIGRVLRRTSLDEIPQIVSVIYGDMSIVGPRPPLPSQIDLIEMRRLNGSLRLRPGLTGLAQVNSFDGMSERQKADWDGRYGRSTGFLMDAVVITRTFAYLLRKPPQY